jgi:acetoin utilization protein AcuB
MLERLQYKRERIRQFLSQGADYDRPTAVLVRDAMTSQPMCVSRNATLLDVVNIFHVKQFRHLLVVDERRLAGVLSDRDVLRCYGPEEKADPSLLSSIRVADVMSEDVVSISAERPLCEAIDMLVDNGVNCLPVVEEGILVGIITSSDFYAVLQAMIDVGVVEPMTAAK